MLKKASEGVFCHVMVFGFFCNAPKSKNFVFGSFPALKLITCFLFEMPHFFMFENLKMPHLSYVQNQMGKWGISKFSNIEKMRHQIKMPMPSHDKITSPFMYEN